MNIKSKKIYIFLFAMISLLLNLTYASNVINTNDKEINGPNTPVSVHDDSSFESESINKSEEEMNEEARLQYEKEVMDALSSVALPPVYNLPSPFRQTTHHPSLDTYFGKVSDETPIFSVDLSNEEAPYNNMMCLTFDSAYINKYTYDILDELDKYDAKATFFMTYEFMEKNPDQIMEIIKRGHEIGNHSTTHPDFNKIKDTAVIKEVMKPHNYIKNLVGVEMCLFRYPFGSYSPRTLTLIKNMGYYPIQWTLDSIDWKNYGKETLLERILTSDKVGPGSIILFHNGATYTPEALPEILDELYNKRGLKCVKVSDLIYFDDFHIFRGTQYKGPFKFASAE